jgi:hypothetical protein
MHDAKNLLIFSTINKLTAEKSTMANTRDFSSYTPEQQAELDLVVRKAKDDYITSHQKDWDKYSRYPYGPGSVGYETFQAAKEQYVNQQVKAKQKEYAKPAVQLTQDELNAHYLERVAERAKNDYITAHYAEWDRYNHSDRPNDPDYIAFHAAQDKYIQAEVQAKEAEIAAYNRRKMR